jgi:hypothetical protein
MIIDSSRRKFPRLFLAHTDDKYLAIVGARLQWPGGVWSQVLDMSYAGLAVSSQGVLSQFKNDEVMTVQLRIGEAAPFDLQVRIVRISAPVIALKIETTSVDGRLKIDQHLKDQVIGAQTRIIDPELLHPSAKAHVWYHGPFDTNIFIWKDSEGAIQKLMIEYDNVLWNWDGATVNVVRSYSATDEAKGYAAPYLDTASPKVSMGASWSDRLKKMLVQIPDENGQIKKVFEIVEKASAT